ncbi:MAG: hypothetical protein ACOCPX_06650 [Halapricum sp.]
MLNEKTGAVLTVVVLFLSAVGGVATATDVGGTESGIVAASNGDEVPLNETVSNADEAYVASNGSVVLVYEYEDSDDLEATSGHASMHAADGVAEFGMNQDVETDVAANVSLLATPDEMSADGTAVADRPAPLKTLRFESDSVQNRTVSESSMALNSTVAVPQDSELSFLFFVLQEARTSGTVTTDATSMDADGSASVQLATQMLPDRSHRFVLTEQDETYTLEVEESYVLGPEQAGDWNTSDRAQTTLEAQYCEGVNATNATCDVSLDSYELTEASDGQRLDIAYTVTVGGIDAAISEAIVEGVAGPETNMTEAEATELADRIENVTLSHVEAEMAVENGSMGGQQASVAWNVSLDGTDDLTLAYVDLLERIEQTAATSPQTPDTGVSSGTFGVPMADTADQIREQTEARRDAGLETTSSWAFDLTTGQNATGEQFIANLNGTAASETTNWDDYVTELEDRDIPITDSMRAAFDARTDGDRVVAEGSASVADEGMFERALTEYNRTTNQTEVAETIEAIRAADFEHARLSADVADGTTTVQGNLSVGDGTAVSDRLPRPFSMIEASETNLDEGRTAVQMDAGLGSDADRDTVRTLAFVGEETDISMSGEWDEESRSMVSLAASEGGTDDGTNDETDDGTNDETDDGTNDETDDGETDDGTDDGETEAGDGDGPGFGVAIALLGAAGGAAIARRRTEP